MLTRFLHILFFISVVVTQAQSISNPSITCVSVAANGDVVVSWNPVTDPDAEFVSYEIIADGISVSTINTIGTNSFTHTTSNAQNASISYVLRINGNGTSGVFALNSTAFQTIFLDVVNNADGFATLNWTIPTVVNSGKFYIHRSIGAAPYQLIDSVNYPTNTYKDEIFGICNATNISYRVSHLYNASCESFSNQDTDSFVDILAPSEVVLFDLDVNPANGHTTLTWIESPEPDVVEYKILKLDPVTKIFNQIDVILGKSNTTYTDVNAGTQSASVASQSYKIIAVDACGFNRGLDFFNTLFISGNEVTCTRYISFSWNAFITGQTSNLQIVSSTIVEIAQFYELWADYGAGFTFVTQLNKGVLRHTLNNILADSLICYQIRAKLPNGEYSVSNQFCYNLRSKDASLTNYTAYASVTENDFVELKFYTERVVNGNTIDVYKSEDDGLSYSLIHSRNVNNTIMNFTDSLVDVNSQSYSYYFVLKDVCNLNRDTSNIAKTIHLTTQYSDFDVAPNFYWNTYQNYFSGVDTYSLIRSVNDNPFTELVQLDNSTLKYEDSINNVLSTSFKTLCYKVVALEDNSNIYGFKEQSSSNKVCIQDKPTVYIPSGFVIGGSSGLFIPKFTYLIEKNYRFTIYNRWGQTVFDTNEPLQGWDGFFNGTPVPTGSYSYKITYKDERNEDQILVGSVTVVN